MLPPGGSSAIRRSGSGWVELLPPGGSSAVRGSGSGWGELLPPGWTCTRASLQQVGKRMPAGMLRACQSGEAGGLHELSPNAWQADARALTKCLRTQRVKRGRCTQQEEPVEAFEGQACCWVRAVTVVAARRRRKGRQQRVVTLARNCERGAIQPGEDVWAGRAAEKQKRALSLLPGAAQAASHVE
eukprot:366406-Chlamydomonas_euryale.AAC.36